MHNHLCEHRRRLEKMDACLMMQSCTLGGCKEEKVDAGSLEERPAQRQLLAGKMNSNCPQVPDDSGQSVSEGALSSAPQHPWV